MSSLKRIVILLSMLVLVLAILAFVLENQQLVSLSFLGFSGPQLPMSLVVVITLLVGMIAGPVMGLFFGRSGLLRRKRLT